MKKISIGVFVLVVAVCAIFILNNTEYAHVITEVNKIERNLFDLPSRCDGMEKTNNFADDMMNCRFPFPPLGRWKAVYTAEFAKQYSLPLENITTNLSEGVDYMEMETLPRTEGKEYTICMVNMLVKKPHDIAMVGEARSFPKVPKDRRILHLIDLEIDTSDLKPLTYISSSSTDYYQRKKGFSRSSDGAYIENAMKNYDYFTGAYNCRSVSMHPNHFPEKFAFKFWKASVWGKYHQKFTHPSQAGYPNEEEINNSFIYIPIPPEIILSIFKDVPVGGN